MTARSIRRATSTATDLELVDAAQAGDAEAFDVLVERYRRFVRSRSRGYFLIGGDRDDLEQEALIGFYKSVRDFRPELQASFRSFAELCINRQLITAIKTATRKKHVPLNQSISFSAPRGDDGDDRSDDDVLLAIDPQSDPLEQLVAREDVAATHAVLAANLSELEVEVLTRYVAGASYDTIAEEVGRHVKAVDNALQRVKRKLAQHLADQAAFDAVG
ncbi:MAG TPA: RNA polymerase sporulation sigma factor SigH [Aquihabitans sp.]|jgi:RNA polymerase sporulation-specific sigma factor|nr:RNA polymerase sporulation sigma factor SigH [Aquihabitans sp.]